MDRIKDITKLRLFKGGVLIKIHEKEKRHVQLLDEETSTEHNFSHGEIIAMADNVEWLKIGDIVLDFGNAEVFKWHEDKYCIVMDMTINLVTDAKNFDVKKAKELAT